MLRCMDRKQWALCDCVMLELLMLCHQGMHGFSNRHNKCLQVPNISVLLYCSVHAVWEGAGNDFTGATSQTML